jgi:hypothetical protein
LSVSSLRLSFYLRNFFPCSPCGEHFFKCNYLFHWVRYNGVAASIQQEGTPLEHHVSLATDLALGRTGEAGPANQSQSQAVLMCLLKMLRDNQ